MEIHTHEERQSLGQAAAAIGASRIRASIASRGFATVVVATGTSQYELIEYLIGKPVEWAKVTLFHLDEYVGLPATHPASFRNYLRKRLVSHLPSLGAFHEIDGENEARRECERLSALISQHPIDVLFAGIGENAHLAFNDPPADFEEAAPYIVVTLDEACRRQQVGEGWFKSVADVPGKAISMTIRQIMSAELLVISVPDERKARAVRCSIEGPVTPDCPASILQRHPQCHLYLDRASASLLAR